MSDIIESVARATNHAECEPHKAETGYGDIFGWDDVMPQVRERHRVLARAAIKATIEHLRDNVTDTMISVTRKEMDAGCVPFNLRMEHSIKAALSEALKEIDGHISQAPYPTQLPQEATVSEGEA
jgi:hypothetical protein